MKKFWFAVCFFLPLISFLVTSASAHFGMVISSDSMVMQDDSRTVNLSLSFSHPFEMVGMPLEKPAKFFVVTGDKQTDLKHTLKEATVMDHAAWQAAYPVKFPGLYTFCMEPVPYWEPAENCFIIHYTKTVVAAFGDDEGWDQEVGLKTEIVPLSKPFGLYAGNVFQGIVKLNGKPVPYAEVEVEYYNRDKKAQAPSDYMITQTLKADGAGVFTYAAPVPGWWGFAALNTADFKLEHKGEKKDVELGAVLWVEFSPWQ
ncbi:MAG: DUF4198 domain-containing protein [Thermodesulfobacteriota bacterium]